MFWRRRTLKPTPMTRNGSLRLCGGCLLCSTMEGEFHPQKWCGCSLFLIHSTQNPRALYPAMFAAAGHGTGGWPAHSTCTLGRLVQPGSKPGPNACPIHTPYGASAGSCADSCSACANTSTQGERPSKLTGPTDRLGSSLPRLSIFPTS